jgi:hypothetical protein
LHDIKKKQNRVDMVRAIETINASGIKVSGSFIAGSETDTSESLLKTVDFAIEKGLDSFYFISLWYYPGDSRCPLQLERLIMPSFDYCTGNFVTHFPALMRPSTLQRTLVDAQRRFWSFGRAVIKAAAGDFKSALHLATHRYVFASVEKHQLEYSNFLKSIEHGYYDDNQRLRTNRIANRKLDPIVAQAYTTVVPEMNVKRSSSK